MSKRRGRPFPAGNAAGRGRPTGSRNKATQVSQAGLFSQYAEPLTKKCMAEALKGEPVAMRLAMERLCPSQRDRAVELPLPPVQELADLPVAAKAVMQAVSDGELTRTRSANDGHAGPAVQHFAEERNRRAFAYR